jgi:hypothetical protein
MDDPKAKPPQQVDGLTVEQWQAIYREGMPEFAATTFAYTCEGEFIRLAFGVPGPYLAVDGARSARYNLAVTIPRRLAVDVAHLLLKLVAEPEKDTPPKK